MALYEFFCTPCKLKFEQITKLDDADAGQCPKCLGRETERLISRFAVAGQGDLRESTLHGCHSDPGGHTHGPGCGHGGSHGSHGSSES